MTGDGARGGGHPLASKMLTLLLVLSALALGCGGSDVRADDTPTQVSKKAEDALGACDLNADFLHPLSQIELIERASRLVRIVDYAPETNDLILESEVGGQIQTQTFGNEADSTARALEWGLANFDTVHVAETSDGRIGFAVGQWATERAAIIQPCANHFIGGLFTTTFGEDHEADLLAFMTGDAETRASIVAELSGIESQ